MVGLVIIINVFAVIGYLLTGVLIHSACSEKMKNYEKLTPSKLSEKKLPFILEVFSVTVLWPLYLPLFILLVFVVNKVVNHYENKFSKTKNIVKQSMFITKSRGYRFYIDTLKPLVNG
jgi:hypothetical protein